MRLGRTCVLVSATLAASAPARANMSAVHEPGAMRLALAEGAECLVDAKSNIVTNFLALFPGSSDAARQAGYLSKIECVSSATGAYEVTYSPEILRGALYKALYVRDFADRVPGLAATSPDFHVDTAGGRPEDARDYVVMRQFAECVVRKDTAAARALVLAPTESSGEAAAFRDLQPDLSPCFVQGGSAQISKSAFTGLVAEALYRLSIPNAVASLRN
jgi:hypothetical protein